VLQRIRRGFDFFGSCALTATVIHFRSNGETATALTADARFVYCEHVPSFLRNARNEQAKADALKIGELKQ
jgi:hypothetical protein